MYRNALYQIGELLLETNGITNVYIQQRDFKDQFDLTNTIGTLQKNSDVLAVVKTSGITSLYKLESFGTLGFVMSITIELFAKTDAEKDYRKSSEYAFDAACLNVLKKFAVEYGYRVEQSDGTSATLYISTVDSVSPKEMTALDELNINAHHLTFNLTARETILNG